MSRFIFNGLNINSGNYRIKNINFEDLGDIETQTFDAPMKDGGGVLSQYYRGKKINIDISLTGSSTLDINNAIDILKRDTAGISKILEVDFDNDTRWCLATRTALSINRRAYDITFIPNVRLSLTTLDPHWKSIIQTTHSNTITGNDTLLFDVEGTAPTEPVFTFTFAGSGNTGITSLTMVYQSKTFVVTHAFTNSDVVVINTSTKSITLNGIEIDYTGYLSMFNVGMNSVALSFNVGATVNTSLLTSYYKTYF